MVLKVKANIDMTLAVKAKEQYLIGHYDESLETFRLVQSQIVSYTAELSEVMELGDPEDFEAAEKEYSQWQKTLQFLQEEFSLVRQIQETCALFKTTPTGPVSNDISVTNPVAPVAAAAASRPGRMIQEQPPPAGHLTDAQLQQQHLAQQAATDVRDPDVWPPPTTEAPVRKPRVSSVGGLNSNWQKPIPNRTPIKPPPASSLSRDNSHEDTNGGDQPSARMPDWVNKNKPAASVISATKPPAPKLARKISNPPPPAASQQSVVERKEPVAAPPKRGSLAAAAANRKPAVPTAGRKVSNAAASSGHARKGSQVSSASSKEDEPVEEGGRVKYEAASKEEQEMAEMIEREILDKKPNVKMADIAGLAGAKQLLTEAVVLPRLIPGYFTGKRKPWRGVLLFGPPGTGKTLLAKAVATECGTTFFNVSPAVVTSKYRGDSEKLMKLLFEMARFYAPSTIFMDEVDGLCSARGGGGEHEASRRVKGEILGQMDGATQGEYDPSKQVIVLGATNLPWELDTAFLRRFEKRVHIDLPDPEGRQAMFRINTEGMSVSEDCIEGGTWKYLVDLSEGYSGADIAVVCNDASMLGLRRLLAGKTPDEMKKMNKDEFNVPISRADFESVFNTVKSSAGKNDLEKYREWMREFGSAI